MGSESGMVQNEHRANSTAEIWKNNSKRIKRKSWDYFRDNKNNNKFAIKILIN